MPKRVAERIDIVLDILVAGDYHSAIDNLEILKTELLKVAESTPYIPRHRGYQQSCLQVFLFEDARRVSIFYLVL